MSLNKKEFKTPLEGALHMFDEGFKVFPLAPGTKIPLKDLNWREWCMKATRQKIERTGTANANYNWGIATGESKLLVVDLDNKKGKDGIETFKHLLSDNAKDLTNTLTTITPTGGRHLIYRAEGYPNSAGLLGDGIDTRGEGGYIVCPGSIVGEKYRIHSLVEIAPLPSWLGRLLRGKKKRDVQILDDTVLIPEGERNTTLVSLAGTMRRRGCNYDTILAALKATNETKFDRPLSENEVERIAESISSYKPEEAVAASDFLEIPTIRRKRPIEIKPKEMHPRQWVMGGRYIGGFISVIIAPGGVGKSTLTLLDAISVATNKPLSGYPVLRPGPVWIYNTEDPMDELDKRIYALASEYNLSMDDINKIHYSSGQETPLILAKSGKDGVVINQSAMQAIVKDIKQEGIKLLIADPFVRTHECNENDNMQIDKVVWCFQRIAAQTGCAVGLVHHTRKPPVNNKNSDMNDARGASSLINAARVAHTLLPMSDREAKKLSIAIERKNWYMRLESVKSNLTPPSSSLIWFERKSVSIITGDKVGTLKTSDLLEKSSKQFDEEKNINKSILGQALNYFLEIGESISLRELYVQLSESDYFYDLLPHYKKSRPTIDNPFGISRRGEQAFRKLLEQNKFIVYENKQFTFSGNSKGKNRYSVKCEKLDDMLLE